MVKRLLPVLLLIGVLGACGTYAELSPEADFSSSVDGQVSNIEPGTITAGEWNDADNWDFWMDLYRNNEDLQSVIGYWEIDAHNRVPFTVIDGGGTPVYNAEVSLLDVHGAAMWTAITDNKGEVNLWSGLLNIQDPALQVRVQYRDEVVLSDLEGDTHQIQLSQFMAHSNRTQIMFAIDATASMGDELEFLKVELGDVIDRVGAALPERDVQTGALIYRDRTDTEVYNISPLTTQLSTTQAFLSDQEARGGGDFPEAVDLALSLSLDQQGWDMEAKSRLLFLLLDAPPHSEVQVKESIHESLEKAAEMGIKVIPITASGIDKGTEFLMRLMALATQGSYVFITDDSGIGDPHLEPTVGQYEVEYLNDLLVRLIVEYST